MSSSIMKQNTHRENQMKSLLPICLVRWTEEIQQLSSRVYDLLGCRGIVRVDFIIVGDRPHFLEINTIPGMTNESLVPKQAQAAGIGLDELYSMVIEALFK